MIFQWLKILAKYNRLFEMLSMSVNCKITRKKLILPSEWESLFSQQNKLFDQKGQKIIMPSAALGNKYFSYYFHRHLEILPIPVWDKLTSLITFLFHFWTGSSPLFVPTLSLVWRANSLITLEKIDWEKSDLFTGT